MPVLSTSLLSWIHKVRKPTGEGALARARQAFRETTMPLMSSRRGRRLLRREQLFGTVRESLIRGGILSSSYSFKVLCLDKHGDSFLVLVELALPAQAMPDEYLLEIERWIQQSAQARHAMEVRSVYWRRKHTPEQVGQALRAAMVSQTRREAERRGDTAIPRPAQTSQRAPTDAVDEAELLAFRRALQAAPPAAYRHPSEPQLPMPAAEAVSDFAALSETQYDKL